MELSNDDTKLLDYSTPVGAFIVPDMPGVRQLWTKKPSAYYRWYMKTFHNIVWIDRIAH